MSEVEQAEPGEDIVAFHRQTIINVACAAYYVSPNALILSPKEAVLLKELAGIVAFLLEQDTNAARGTIADLIGCTKGRVASFIQKIVDATTKEGDARIVEKLGRIKDDVFDAVEQRGVVWHRRLKEGSPEPWGPLPLAWDDDVVERVIRALLLERPSLARSHLKSVFRGREVVWARDVVFAILDTLFDATNARIGSIFHKSGLDVTNALKRMQTLDVGRRTILEQTCKRLCLPVSIIIERLGAAPGNLTAPEQSDRDNAGGFHSE